MLNNRKWVKYGKNREKQEIFKWLIIRTMNYFISLWFPWLVPALALGGKEAIDNIHILKTIPYIEMSPNLSGIWNKCNNRLLTKRDNAQTAFPANLLKGSQRVHWKRMVNFALFFYARFQFCNQWLRNFIPTGQFQTAQDKCGHSFLPIQI